MRIHQGYTRKVHYISAQIIHVNTVHRWTSAWYILAYLMCFWRLKLTRCWNFHFDANWFLSPTPTHQFFQASPNLHCEIAFELLWHDQFSSLSAETLCHFGSLASHPCLMASYGLQNPSRHHLSPQAIGEGICFHDFTFATSLLVH